MASFANALGGWLFLGVDDDGSLVGYSLPAGTDAQSHIGQLLAAEVEPLPPFVCAAYELDGKSLLITRVFESADTPHLLKATGGIPIRTPAGTDNVTDQRLLLDLARRGEDAMARARERLSMDMISLELAAPERSDLIAASDAEPYAIVRASLVTPSPHFADWALSKSAGGTATGAAREVARILGITLAGHDEEVSVRGRGVTAAWTAGFQVPVRCRFAIDAGGVVGGRLSRGIGDGRATAESFRSLYISPLVLAVGDMLKSAGAYGRAAWRVDIGLPRQDFEVVDASNQLRQRRFFASAEGGSPPSFQEAAEMTDAWWREFARELGRLEWSP